MAEEIVACPGCGKKFRIPEGAPGGSFQCTACNATVPYGKAAPRSGVKGSGANGARSAAGPARSAAAGARAAGGSSARRRGRADDAADAGDAGHGRAKKKDGEKQAILWTSIGVLVLAGGIGAFLALRKKEEPAPPPKTPAPAAAPAAQDPPPQPAPVAPTPPAAGTPGAGTGEGPKPEDKSGIGGSKTVAPAGGSLANLDALFVRIEDVPGVTPQERAEYDKDVALFVDFDAGKAGNEAYKRLKRLGRRAIPALLSSFEAPWKGKKWDDPKEKWASFQVQQLLAEIVEASRPGGDFFARYVPQNHGAVPSTDFQRAARMWADWWLNRGGKDIEKFKEFAD